MAAFAFPPVPKLRITSSTREGTSYDSPPAAHIEMLQALHAGDGCLCFSSMEDVCMELRRARGREQLLQSPWVGFIQRAFSDHLLEEDGDLFNTFLEQCRGIFVDSSATRETLAKNVPCCRYRPPVTPAPLTCRFSVKKLKVNKQRKLMSFGGSSQMFSDLPTPADWQKYRIASSWERHQQDSTDTVVVVDRQPDAKLHQLLADSVVFLYLINAEENETVLDCIAHQTPVIVNQAPSTVEYLGSQYPLFYDTLEDISGRALLEEDKLEEAKQYLAHVPQRTEERFIRDIQNSAIYRSLPIPTSQVAGSTSHNCRYLKTYDVTVLICTYTRLQNLPEILDRLCQQDFQGR